ncbi:MAG: hypothetical protein IPK22_26440 [Verrucomicrobiaceae bacterium]|nr:hypothetical protein [Verrucomicrobiaceae bacterium]
MNKILALAYIGMLALGGTVQVSAAVLANTTANGTAYFTYDRAAWATVTPNEAYTTISGVPTGASGPTADVAGQRWMFPDRFEGTAWVAAAYPSSYLTGPTAPLASTLIPMLVNSYGTNSFAANHKITDYNSTTNPFGYIGLGGSLRATSDFNQPGASVWWEHLALRKDSADNVWKIYATSGAGNGSIFELMNVTEETVNGNLHLSGDYKFGNTDWYQFFQSSTAATINPNMVLGHIDLTPAPEPAKALLSAFGGMLVVLRRRRDA